MSYFRAAALASIHVSDHKNLLAAWRLHGRTGLVGRFVVEKPLTAAQSRRLPADLRRLLK